MKQKIKYFELTEFVMLSILPSSVEQLNSSVPSISVLNISLIKMIILVQKLSYHSKKTSKKEKWTNFEVHIGYSSPSSLKCHHHHRPIILGKRDRFWDPLWLWKHVWIFVNRYLLCCWSQYYDTDHNDDGDSWWFMIIWDDK